MYLYADTNLFRKVETLAILISGLLKLWTPSVWNTKGNKKKNPNEPIFHKFLEIYKTLESELPARERRPDEVVVSEPVVKNGNKRLPVSVLVVYSVLVSSAFAGGGVFHLGLVLFVFFGFWFAASLLGCLWIHFQSFSISTLLYTYKFKIAFQLLFQPPGPGWLLGWEWEGEGNGDGRYLL